MVNPANDENSDAKEHCNKIVYVDHLKMFDSQDSQQVFAEPGHTWISTHYGSEWPGNGPSNLVRT
jgi:hypothetical protein